MKEPIGFAAARIRAAMLAQDASKVSSLLSRAMSKAHKNKGHLKDLWEDLMSLLVLIRSWVNGEYREIPWKSIVLAIAAVIYFVNPFDLIPDFLPFIGYADDATVIGFVIASLRKDIQQFRAWKESSSNECDAGHI